MKIGPDTTVYDLLTKYPFLKEYAINLHPHFKALNNPVMMNTFGKIATLDKAANAADIPLDKFLAGITDEIKSKTGEIIEIEDNS